MEANSHSKPLTFISPGTYQICVQGSLTPAWSDRLGGMTISVSFQENHEPITTLIGTLPDQSALVGILNSLYNLQLPVLSVTFLG